MGKYVDNADQILDFSKFPQNQGATDQLLAI